MDSEMIIHKPENRKERWYLAIIAFFLVIFAANSYLVWLSVDSSRGLTIDKKYEHGVR